MPGRCAEIERGFFLGAIEFLQAGKEFGGGDRDQGSGMTQEDSEETELCSDEDGKHEKRETGDDTGEDEREKHEAAEERLARETSAIEGEGGEQAE